MEGSLLPGSPPLKRQRNWWQPTVEPLIFLVTIGSSISNVPIRSFFIQRICEFDYSNETIQDLNSFCSNLTEYKEQEAQVEADFATFSTYRTFLSVGPPLILALFWGELNDRWGSKPLMFVPLGGYLASSLIFYLLTLFPGTPPALLLLAFLPEGLSGAGITLTVSLFKLVINSTTPSERTFRIGLAEASMLLASPIGLLIGAQILDLGGFGFVFLVSGVFISLAILYGIFFVEGDERRPRGDDGELFKSVSWERMKELKEFWSRSEMRLILLLVSILCLRTFVMGGNAAVMFLFTRFKFGWNAEEFANFSTFDGTVASLGVLAVCTVALKIFHVADALLGALAGISFLVGNLFYAFAVSPFLVYMGSAVQFCDGISNIIIRSMVSGAVKKEDVGKALSFISIPQNIMPFLSTPAYTAIYMSTLHGFIGTPFLVSAALNILVILGYTYMYIMIPINQSGAVTPVDERSEEEEVE